MSQESPVVSKYYSLVDTNLNPLECDIRKQKFDSLDNLESTKQAHLCKKIDNSTNKVSI
jgi:hypothetical protein